MEHALTTDGVEYYSYHGDGVSGAVGETNVEREKNRGQAQGLPPSIGAPIPNTSRWSVRMSVRSTRLWVINNLANPRPTLETYKYEMPGDNHIPIDHIILFDMEAHTHADLQAGAFKDQDEFPFGPRPPSPPILTDDYAASPNGWAPRTRFIFSRTSRDLQTWLTSVSPM